MSSTVVTVKRLSPNVWNVGDTVWWGHVQYRAVSVYPSVTFRRV